jgi:hypothetical protein
MTRRLNCDNRKFEWTSARIAAVKRVAAAAGTAREACEAVELDPEREHLVYRLAKQRGFKFRNVGRKRNDRAIFLRLDQAPSDILTERARRAGVVRRELAAKLLNVVLAQGDTFLDNLLDEGA